LKLLKKPPREVYSFFPSSFEMDLAFTLDFNKLDACTSKKVYKKKIVFILTLPYLHRFEYGQYLPVEE
jgi:hypothetical protein